MYIHSKYFSHAYFTIIIYGLIKLALEKTSLICENELYFSSVTSKLCFSVTVILVL